MKNVLTTAAMITCLTLSAYAKPTVPSQPIVLTPAATDTVAGISVPLMWHDSLDSALTIAAVEYQPVLAFFTSPDCTWCDRLKQGPFRSPEAQRLLRNFSLAEINVLTDNSTIYRYRLRGVPTILILSADGEVQDGVNGYVSATELAAMLRRALSPEFLKSMDEAYAELLKMLDDNNLPDEKLPYALTLLGDKVKREELHTKLFSLDPFPVQTFVSLLEHQRLAVRLGALELLEELSGGSFGFDPWLFGKDLARNRDPLLKWDEWATRGSNTFDTVYSALTDEQAQSYLRDVIGDNRDRSIRAIRMLQHIGPGSAGVISTFIKQNVDLPEGARKRLKEIQYSLYLPSIDGFGPQTVAHRLVFGTLDLRLKTLSSLQKIGKRSVPVLADFFDDPDPIVRETAVDTILAAGKHSAIPLLQQHLEIEKDVEVIYTALRGLGKVRSRRGLKILISYLSHSNEDLVIAALNSIAELKSKSAADRVGVALTDSRWRVRVAAMEAVAKLKLAEHAPAIEKMLDDEDDFVKHTAVITLSKISAKGATKKLEDVFAKEDSLKGPVVAAFGSMDVPLPRSFAEQLANKPSEVLLAVLLAMEDCTTSDLAMAAKFLDHDDTDVACAAVRLLAGKGLELAAYQTRITEILKGDNNKLILATLESISIDDDDLAALSFAANTASTDDTNNAGDKRIQDLLMAFEGEDVAGGASAEKEKTPPVAATKPSPLAPTMQEIWANLLGAGKGIDIIKAFEPKESVGHQLGGLINEAEACMKRTTNDDIRFAAILLLARVGKPSVIPYLREGLDSRTVRERASIASELGRMNHDDILPVLRRLLADPSESVRTSAASSSLQHKTNTKFLEMILFELIRPGAALKPHEIYGYQLTSAMRSVKQKKSARKWVADVLSGDYHNTVQILAMVMLDSLWKDVDKKLVEEFLTSTDPFQRRAAFYVLGKHDKKAFNTYLDKVVSDTSEHVRIVIPHIHTRDSSGWVHYFDAKHIDADRNYYSSFTQSRRKRSSNPEVTRTLKKLTEDASPKVRIEAFFSLLSRHESIDLAAFISTIDSLPDKRTIGYRVASFLTENYRKLGQEFRILVPYLDYSYRDADSLKPVRNHFNITPGMDLELLQTIGRIQRERGLKATFIESADAVIEPEPQVFKLAFFTSVGCSECKRVARLLDELRDHFPDIEVETLNIRKLHSMRFNESLCERFRVPDKVRLVTPAVFSGAGYLIGRDIRFSGLCDLIAKSATIPLDSWYDIDVDELAKAETSISERYSAMGVGVVAAAGLLDGVNPCAFATIIFLLSYLQLTRRTPKQIALVGVAFVAGVFLAYLALGFGFIEIVLKIGFLRHISRIMNWIIAGFALTIMVLSIRDGFLCLQGRLKDTTLQLPGLLKSHIQKTIRRGSKHAHFVAAAFVVGVVISLLELACTGQVYAPTILFMLKTGTDRIGAAVYLTIYNLAFITPLLVVFALACFGLTHNALTQFLQKHAALVKFCTAALFFVLFLTFIFGSRLGLP